MISPDIHDHVFSTKAHHLDSSNLFAFSVSSYYSSAFACSEYKGKSLDKSRYSFIEDSITNKYERPDISFVDDKLSELENSSKYEEQHVYSDAYEMAKDKYGCRELQKRIIENDPAVIKAIFDQIAPHLTELMEDQFGNYLFEKILKHSDKESLLKILRIVSPSI